MTFDDIFPSCDGDESFGSSLDPTTNDGSQLLQKLASLSAKAILERRVEPEDYLFADESGAGLFSTIDFCQVYGETGAGKTLWALSLAAAIAGGAPFMDWRCTSPRKVIYVDGELAETTIRQRLESALSALPKAHREIAENNLLIFSREIAYQVMDYDLAPLDSDDGWSQVAEITQLWEAEAIIFDSRFCLLGSDMKEQGSMPKELILWLRSQRIFQLWLHHTGKDSSRGGYGDKTAEFLMDTNIQLSPLAKQPGKVKLEFKKARKRDDSNSHYYQNREIQFSNGRWNSNTHIISAGTRKKTRTLALEAEILNIVEKNMATQATAHAQEPVAVTRHQIRDQLVDARLVESINGSIIRADRTLVDRIIRTLIEKGKLEETRTGISLPTANDDSISRTPIGGYE
jgi:AAA domain